MNTLSLANSIHMHPSLTFARKNLCDFSFAIYFSFAKLAILTDTQNIPKSGNLVAIMYLLKLKKLLAEICRLILKKFV